MAIRRTITVRSAAYSQNADTIRSINSILTDYKAFVDVVQSEAERILEEAANMVLDETYPFVPRDTYALMSSGKAEAVTTGKGVQARVSFGGVDNPVTPTRNAPTGIVDYAVKVHEDLESYHTIGEAKFLEKGTAAALPKVDAYIKKELAKLSPKGGTRAAGVRHARRPGGGGRKSKVKGKKRG